MTDKIQDLKIELKRRDKFIKQVKSRVSTLKVEVTRNKVYLKTLQHQYERVIREQRKSMNELLDSAPKLFYSYLIGKFSAFREKFR